MGLVFVVACGGAPPGEVPVEAEAGGARTVSLPDTLLFTTRSGYEIWWTVGRDAVSADGTLCVERTVTIVKDTVRRMVPLLYTTEPPRVLNDSIIRAVLSTRCEPGDVYRVHLGSGIPITE